MSQNLTATVPFRSGHVRAMAACIFLGISIFTDFINLASNAFQVSTGRGLDPNSEELDLSLLLDLAFGLLQLTVAITTIVLFCMWLHRAYSNLPALGHPKHTLNYSPAWAVGSFFVPFVNLVIPYRAVKEVWIKSDPSAEGDQFISFAPSSVPAYFTAWWAVWIVSNFVNNIATRLYFSADTEAEMTRAVWFDMAGTVLTMPAAALAILVVRSIDARQEARSRIVNYIPNLPPPPPIFHTPADSPR